MRDKNFPSKGINIKKANIKFFITNKKNKIEKKELLKINYFKDLNLFLDFIKNEREVFEYTKDYFLTCKKQNNIEYLLNIDENDESKSIKLFLPENHKQMFLSKFNPEKEDNNF